MTVGGWVFWCLVMCICWCLCVWSQWLFDRGPTWLTFTGTYLDINRGRGERDGEREIERSCSQFVWRHKKEAGRNSLADVRGKEVIIQPPQALCSVFIFFLNVFYIFSSLTYSFPFLFVFFVFGLCLYVVPFSLHHVSFPCISTIVFPLIHSQAVSVPGVGTVFILDVVILLVGVVITGLSQSSWKPPLPSPVCCHGDHNDIFSVTNHHGWF